jgi:putative FmdB family regulatory protein
MPIYEYECKSCGHRQEVIQKMSDDPLVECSACHEPQLKKLISAAAFHLKGGGWYETDFKGGNKKSADKTESGGGEKPAADAKPAGGCGSGACGCH